MKTNIKKVLFSLLFVFVFGIYVIYERANMRSNNPILNNNNLASNSSPNGQNQNPTQITNPAPAPATTTNKSGYKDGQYAGNSIDAFYGTVQVQATISVGKIIDIKFLNYPQDRQHSLELSNYALPQLKSEAIQSQKSNVDIISGATATSEAFIQSLASALSKAS